MPQKNLDNLCVNTIRMLSVDMIEKAKSGHPGMPMGAAAMAYVLWTKFLNYNPKSPDWLNRDRFVLSAGHGSALLYSLLHLSDYDLSLNDLKNFRQWGSKTAGHPEYGLAPGVETTTGPLGQGFATGVGMALAERLIANRYNKHRGSLASKQEKLIDYYIYGIVSDGDLMEGVSGEAASYAGSLKLGKIIYLYDSNNISIEGSTDITFTENVAQRFEAYHWHVLEVKDGNNTKDIEEAIIKARGDKRPSLIIVKTHIGFGSPNKVDTAKAHGSPLGEEELKKTKENLGWPQKSFYVPKEVELYFKKFTKIGKEKEDTWNKKFEQYKKFYPKLAKEIFDFYSGKLSAGWKRDIPKFEVDEKGMATRSASHEVINAIASVLPALLGGSADLAPSNNTNLEGMGDMDCNAPCGIEARNLHFGVREHAMAAILNGLALSKLIIPYGGTFLIFSNYMRPAIRLAALMRLRVVYVFTHDSIGLGEDGPTHQPIEQLMSLRAMPNLAVIRPADANETAKAWEAAIENRDGPTALILTRQKLPVIDQKVYNNRDNVKRGAYILNKENKKPDIILIATGSEVQLALASAEKLKKHNISARVVSMPSWELFEKQSKGYRDEVLPPDVKARLSIEAGVSLGWYKYVGSEGKIIGIDRFGASAPAGVLFEKFGFTVENVVREALGLVKK
jgi:transketolase